MSFLIELKVFYIASQYYQSLKGCICLLGAHIFCITVWKCVLSVFSPAGARGWAAGLWHFKMHSAGYREQLNSCVYVKALKFIIYLQEKKAHSLPNWARLSYTLFLYVKVSSSCVCLLHNRKTTSYGVCFFLNNRTIYVEAEGTINLLQCQVINPVVRKRQQDKGGAGTNQDGDKQKNLSRLYLDQL